MDDMCIPWNNIWSYTLYLGNLDSDATKTGSRRLTKLGHNNVKYAVGTNNSTVEQLVVVMRERTTTLESEQQHQMLLQLTFQRVTMTCILESLAQPLNSYVLGRLPCVHRH